MDWFKHDINTQTDIKIRKLIREDGYTGYGLYWNMVELLYRNGGQLPIEEVREEMEITGHEGYEDTLISLGLLELNDGIVSSRRVLEACSEAEIRRQRFVSMGKASAERRLNISQTKVEHTLSEGSTDKRRKEEIREDKKEKSVNTLKERSQVGLVNKPTVCEVKDFIKSKGFHFSAEDFFSFYESNGWKVGRNPMRDWKAACRTWEARRKQDRRANCPTDINGQYDNETVEEISEL